MLGLLKKILKILDKKQKKSLAFITFFLFVGMILEIFGLSIVFPFIVSLLTPESIELTSVFNYIGYDYMPLEKENYVFFFLMLLLFIFIVKTIFMILISFLQNRLLGEMVAYISTKLFKYYLNQSFEYHININSSVLIKNIQVEISLFRSLCLSLITTVVEISLTLSIFLTLIYFEPKGAMIVIFYFGVVSIIYFRAARPYIKKWGIKREQLAKKLSKILLEGLGAIREVLLLNSQSHYTRSFDHFNHEQSYILAKNGTLKQLPRLLLELFAIIGIILFISVLMYRGEDSSIIISTIGVFVAATFRMIPSLNRIISALQNIKFYLPSVDVIYNEFKNINIDQLEKQSIIKMDFNDKIQIKNVFFKYHSSENWVLKNINFEINKGEFIGIIGPSGSGKSSFIDLIVGLNRANQGEILVDNNSITNRESSWLKSIGYMSQNFSLIDDSILNNITLGNNENDINREQLKTSILDAGLESFINQLKDGLETNIGERGIKLSGGQKQRIGIARALYRDAELLLFDEATSALDNETENKIIESILNLKGKRTVVIVAHRLSTLKYCDKIYEIKDSTIKTSSLQC